MIIDFHTHIFPNQIRDNRNLFFKNEPAFRLLYEAESAKMVGVSKLLAVMDRHGVDLAVTFGFPWHNIDTMQQHNDYVIQAQNRYPERLVGFACVDVYHPQAAREVERCLAAGLRGVGELAFYQSGIDPEAIRLLEPIMEICRKTSVPVMIHTNEPVGHAYPGKSPLTLRQIYRLAAAFPDNRMVLAHWGGGIFFYNLLKKEAKAILKNLWFDTAASPYLYDLQIYQIGCSLAGADKVLFGTDYPLLSPKRYYKQIDKAGLDIATKAAILSENAKHLLNR